MQLPIKAHYATLAMLALAEKYASREVLPARTIALEHGIPSQFLVQILQQLRSAGLVTSSRGASGGFVLEQPPRAITVGEIVDAICPATQSLSSEHASALSNAVMEVWDEVKLRQREVLDRLTLADLLDRARENSHAMFYI